jgi:NADPH-dependent 2,4-dienoyl-CoA reductase/sulfur reductase-like enzyme
VLDVRTQHEVLRIDRDAKEVEVHDRRTDTTYRESYDKLVLCPGGSPIRPPIPGVDDPRVDVLRNTPDMDRIIEHLDAGATRAVVVGGSYIGLELAEAFRERGLETTIVERANRLMPWLDPEMTRILHFHVELNGVEVRLSTSLDAIGRNDDDQLSCRLSVGTELDADCPRHRRRVRPNVELARDAGLEIGTRGGIVVDGQMRTSAPDILAAGDAVESPNLITGKPVLSLLPGPAKPAGADRRRDGRGSRHRLPGNAGHRGGQGVRHDRRRDRADRGRPAA